MADSVVEAQERPKAQPSYLVPPIIAKALIAVQKELEPMVKSSDNEAFGSKYVPLDEVTKKAHELLSRHKIAVIQSPVTDEQGHAALETILVYEDGRTFSRTTKLAMNKVDPQAHGSAITYTRRYALMAMIGLTAKDEDDDGNSATGVHAPVTQEQIDEIKMLLSLIPWPKEEIARAVFALKTRDAATLAIAKYRDLVAQKTRDEESKANAMKIEVGTGGESDDSGSEVEPTSLEGFRRRIKALKLTSPSYENKVINIAAGVPFLEKVMDKQERIQGLDTFLKALESGVQRLEAEFYAPTDEPIVVDEKVA